MITDYLKTLEKNKRRPLTIQNIAYTLNDAQKVLNKNLEECNKDDIVTYLSNSECIANSKAVMLIRLSAFFKYLISIGIINENPCKDIKIKTSLGQPKPFNDEEIETLQNYIIYCKSLDHKVMLSLLLFTGVRISECIHIRLKDVNFVKNTIAIFGKGNSNREVLISNELAQLIKLYIEEKGVTDPNAYIIGRTRDNAYKKFASIAKSLGIENAHPHRIRHTFGTLLTERTTNIEMVSNLMGHSNVLTTQRYVGISTKAMKNKLESSHPIMKGINNDTNNAGL